MSLRRLRSRRGLSLVEMLVTLGIFGILTGVLFISSIVSHRSYVTGDAFVHLQQQARQALDAMHRELHEAGGAIAAAGNQLTFQTALGYNLAAPCPANAICWGARDQAGADQSGWSVRYRLNGTQLVREILNNAAVVQSSRIMANDVSQLSFAYVGGTTRTVTIQLQVTRTSAELAGGSLSAAPTPLVTSIKLRNT
jgi:prepilin-type N-terminal cleavage/methylation domain-containing protein